MGGVSPDYDHEVVGKGEIRTQHRFEWTTLCTCHVVLTWADVQFQRQTRPCARTGARLLTTLRESLFLESALVGDGECLLPCTDELTIILDDGLAIPPL